MNSTGIGDNHVKKGDRAMSDEKHINTGGGAYIGGDVNTGGGKFVGRDDYSTTGFSSDQITRLFESIYQQIDSRQDSSAALKAELKEAVEVIESQVKQGDKADEKALGFGLKSLKRMAPDIWDVVVDTFANPARGIATVIRKVVTKAKEQAGV